VNLPLVAGCSEPAELCSLVFQKGAANIKGIFSSAKKIYSNSAIPQQIKKNSCHHPYNQKDNTLPSC